jgi:hypothetical protein
MAGQGTRFTVDVTITNRGSQSVFRGIDCAHSLEHLEGDTWVQPDTWAKCPITLPAYVPQEIPAGTAVQLHEELFTRDTALSGYTLTTSMIPGKFRMHYYLVNSHNAPFPSWAGRSQEFTVSQ